MQYTQRYNKCEIEYIFGGSAADNSNLKETFVFSRDNFSNHGVVTLVIDRDKVDIRGARAFGWIGIGKERIVTKSHNNVVYEIDGKPAVDFYVKYLDISPDEPIPPIGIEYPLGGVHLLERRWDWGWYIRGGINWGG